MENNEILNNVNNLLNGGMDKFFSCEWKDLEFLIIFGFGIVLFVCIVIGGFNLILGEKKC